MRGMRHFGFLDPADRSRLFLHEPREFSVEDEPERLRVALGATLYCPATRPNLAEDMGGRAAAGAVTAVACLQDAVPAGHLVDAEHTAAAQLRRLAPAEGERPLVF